MTEYPPPVPFRDTFWDEEDFQQSQRAIGDLDPNGGPVEQESLPDDGDGSDDSISFSRSMCEDGTDQSIMPPKANDLDLSGPLSSPRSNDEERFSEPIHSASARSKGVPCSSDEDEEGGDPGVPLALAETPDQVSRRAPQGLSTAYRLADGGLGKRSLALHTKTPKNRHEFFEVYRRTARQVSAPSYLGMKC